MRSSWPTCTPLGEGGEGGDVEKRHPLPPRVDEPLALHPGHRPGGGFHSGGGEPGDVVTSQPHLQEDRSVGPTLTEFVGQVQEHAGNALLDGAGRTGDLPCAAQRETFLLQVEQGQGQGGELADDRRQGLRRQEQRAGGLHRPDGVLGGVDGGAQGAEDVAGGGDVDGDPVSLGGVVRDADAAGHDEVDPSRGVAGNHEGGAFLPGQRGQVRVELLPLLRGEVAGERGAGHDGVAGGGVAVVGLNTGGADRVSGHDHYRRSFVGAESGDCP